MLLSLCWIFCHFQPSVAYESVTCKKKACKKIIFLEGETPTLINSHLRCFVRIGALRNFAKFTGKHLCQSLFFNKVAGLRTATSVTLDSAVGVFAKNLRKLL